MSKKRYFDIAMYDLKEYRESLETNKLLANCHQELLFRGINGDSIENIILGLPTDKAFWIWSINDYKSMMFESYSGASLDDLQKFLNGETEED